MFLMMANSILEEGLGHHIGGEKCCMRYRSSISTIQVI